MSPLFLTLALVAAPTFDVEPLDGPRVNGQIAKLADGRLTLVKSSSDNVAFDLEKVLEITAQAKPAVPAGLHPVRVELRDGSLLVADEYGVHDHMAKIVLAGGGSFEVPIGEVAAVRLQAGSDALAAEWARIRTLKVESDLLVSVKGDSMDYHKGAIQDVTDKIVRFDLDGEVLSVKRAKVFGIVYYHATDAAPTASPYTILDASGSRWAARSLKLAKKLEWLGAGGVALRRDLAEIAQIDLSRGKVVYLSDLKADSAVYTPFLGMEKELPARLEFFRPRRDMTLQSKPIRLGGQTFPKGLTLHSRTEMAFTLPDAFSRLEAVAGIDDELRPRGHVRLVIRGDNKILKEIVVAGGDPPQPLSLDIAGVRRLVILVDFGGDMDVADHLDLGNARLMK